MCDLAIRDAEVTVSSLRSDRHELGVDELGKVRARRLRRDASGLRELARGREFAAEQVRKHACARGIADHRGNPREAGFGIHRHSEKCTRRSVVTRIHGAGFIDGEGARVRNPSRPRRSIACLRATAITAATTINAADINAAWWSPPIIGSCATSAPKTATPSAPPA